MSAELILLEKMIEKKEMESNLLNGEILNKDTFKQLQDLKNDVFKLTFMLTNKTNENSINVSQHEIYKLYDDIATDVNNVYHMVSSEVMEKIKQDIIKFKIYTLSEFIDEYVDHQKNEAFRKLFKYVDNKIRNNFIKEHYIAYMDMYYTKNLQYMALFEVNDLKIA